MFSLSSRLELSLFCQPETIAALKCLVNIPQGVFSLLGTAAGMFVVNIAFFVEKKMPANN